MCSMEPATSTTPAVEVWKDIEGYEGLYQVSSLGRVRSIDRSIYVTNKYGGVHLQSFNGCILAIGHNNKGYCQVNLHKNKRVRRFLVSRLVAKAFIPNDANLPCVNHKDQNTDNNCANNLEWCTQQYNVTYNNAHILRGVKFSRPIEQLTLDGKHVAYFASSMEAERIGGFHHSHIHDAINGVYKQHKGYKWRYVE